METNNHLWYSGDTLSIGVLVSTILGYLPAVAAIITVIWAFIRLWETCTVQEFVKGRKLRCSCEFEERGNDK
jgi:hypothetical protein